MNVFHRVQNVGRRCVTCFPADFSEIKAETDPLPETPVAGDESWHIETWQSETLTRKHWSKSRKQLIRSRSKAKSFWNPTSLSANYGKPKSGTGRDYRRRRRSPSHARHFASKPVEKAGKGQRREGNQPHAVLSDKKDNASPIGSFGIALEQAANIRDVASSSMAIIFALIFFPPQTATRAASPQI